MWRRRCKRNPGGAASDDEVFIDNRVFYQGLEVIATRGVHPAVITAMDRLLRPGAAVLDLGAGTGAFTLRLKEKGYQVTATGIDQDSFALKEVPFVYLDLNQALPAEHYGVYDAVAALEVVEHVENVFDFFRKVHLLLKPGGLAFVVTPNVGEVKSRLAFLHLGDFYLFDPEKVEQWGHIQILPSWLLEIAAARAGLRCRQIIGVGDLMAYTKLKWQKLLIYSVYLLKRWFSQERFPGEFLSIELLMILEK